MLTALITAENEEVIAGLEDLGLTPDDLKKTVDAFKNDDIRILIDRFVVSKDDTEGGEPSENTKRMADSVQTAFYESEGEAIIEIIGGETRNFNNRFELDDLLFLEPTPQLFNYNNPYGFALRFRQILISSMNRKIKFMRRA